MSIKIPDSLGDLLTSSTLADLFDAVGPAEAERLDDEILIEIESDDGTFALTYREGSVSAKKGYAKGDPFVSVEVPAGGYALLRKQLEAAVAGFPSAPALKARHDVMRALKNKDLQAVYEGLEKLEDALLELEVKGVGTFRLARGPLDEATRSIAMTLDGKALDAVLSGAPLSSIGTPKPKGDSRLQTEFLAAVGPVLQKIQKA